MTSSTMRISPMIARTGVAWVYSHPGCHALHHVTMVHCTVIHGLAALGVGALELGEQFLGGCERKVVQENDDFLLVTPYVVCSPDNQGGGQQVLLLQRVRMHPVCPAGTNGKRIAAGFGRT